MPRAVLFASRCLLASSLLLVAALVQAQTPAPDPALAPPRSLDVPYVPTPEDVVQRMLELAEVAPGDHVIDLGSGDGRIAISAVRDHGAGSALGVDLDPIRIAEAQRNANAAGVTDKVRFEQGDLFEKDIGEADVLTMYLLPKVNLRLRPVILETLAPGTRVVSHAFTMGDWEPDATEYVAGSYVFLWVVPARVEAVRVVEAEGETFAVALEQQFQRVTGTLRDRPEAGPLDGRLLGDRLQFTLDGHTYVGQVEGERIRASRAPTTAELGDAAL